MVFQEVELKFRATEDQMKVLEKFLDEEATFVDEVHHEEYYLDKSSDPFVTKNVQGYMDAHQYLRVRFSDGQALVCFKDWHTDEEASKLSDHVVHDYCQEYETQVIDGRVMLEFFKALGYDRSTLVDKKRRVYHVDDLEVVIDDVKNLGVFVEVEAQGEYESVDDAKADIVNFLKGLGLDRIDKQQRGYVSMLWNMEVNFGEEMLL